jgi:C4-dicarboxylate-binding protein DctP
MNLKSTIVFAILVVALSVGAAYAQQPIVIKFSHVVAEDTPKGKGALKFKELAEARSKGRVKVDVYANSTLFKDGEEMQMLQLGNVQMLAPSVSKFGPLGAREFEVFDLPYIFDNYKDLHNVTQGRIGQQLFKKLDNKGIIGLAYWDNGFKEMSANKPLKTPADFRGLKMRIQSSKVLDGQMRALGATPQIMAFSDVYQALQTGVVDGTENPPSNLYTQKMNEVQKYLTLSDHGVVEYAVIVNKKFWEGLPADIRTTLEGAMKDATTYTNDIAKQQNEEALEKVKALGKTQIITLTPDEKKAWKKAVLKVHRDNEATIGKELIQEIYKDTGFDPSKL